MYNLSIANKDHKFWRLNVGQFVKKIALKNNLLYGITVGVRCLCYYTKSVGKLRTSAITHTLTSLYNHLDIGLQYYC